MLDRRAVELAGNFGERGLAGAAVVAGDADLDEFVRKQGEVDFVQHGRCQAVLADDDDRIEVVRLCAQRAALGGRERLHPVSVRPVLRPGRTTPPRGSGPRHDNGLRVCPFRL